MPSFATRYTDFLVNEIALNGQVLHLTSTAVPVKITDKKSTGPQHAQDDTKPAEAPEAKCAQEGEGVKEEQNEPVHASASNGEHKDGEPAKVCIQFAVIQHSC
jgi:hypothetical protein